MSETVVTLKENLALKEEQLMQAATIGQALLQENSKLKQQVENVINDYSRKIEAKEQEIYSLQLKYNQKAGTEKWYTEELATLKQDLAKQRNDITDELEERHHHDVVKLKKQIQDLQADLELSQNAERQLKDQVKQMETLVEEQMNETASISRSFYSEELGQAQQDIVSLQNERTMLKARLIDSEGEVRQGKEQMERVKYQLVSKDEEIESLQCQITSYCNNQEKFRMEILDLKAQMDALRMETNSHNSKGNSLFSEVEDRRVKAEKKLISLHVQIESLKERYDIEKQQHSQLKMQMVTLLQMRGGQADADTVKNLQHQLTELNKQYKELLCKNEQLETLKAGQTDPMAEFRKAFPDGGNEDYVQYLIGLLKRKDTDMDKLKRELNVSNMLLSDERRTLLEEQRKNMTVEEEKRKLQGQNVKLGLKNQELLTKYEPEKAKPKSKELVFKTETIPLEETEENAEETIDESHGIEGLDASLFLNTTRNTSILCKSQKDNLPSADTHKDKVSNHKNAKLPGCRTVSISDVVTVNETSFDMDDEEKRDVKEEKPKQVGRVVTRVKKVQAKPVDVNECKNQ